ncbi:MAG: hypothetical protein WCG27_02635 [Pseudomonadota bacterium]
MLIFLSLLLLLPRFALSGDDLARIDCLFQYRHQGTSIIYADQLFEVSKNKDGDQFSFAPGLLNENKSFIMFRPLINKELAVDLAIEVAGHSKNAGSLPTNLYVGLLDRKWSQNPQLPINKRMTLPTKELKEIYISLIKIRLFFAVDNRFKLNVPVNQQEAWQLDCRWGVPLRM